RLLRYARVAETNIACRRERKRCAFSRRRPSRQRRPKHCPGPRAAWLAPPEGSADRTRPRTSWKDVANLSTDEYGRGKDLLIYFPCRLEIRVLSTQPALRFGGNTLTNSASTIMPHLRTA